MVLLESMAAGLPFAAARVGGVPDLVRNRETGLLFDPTNGAEMANAVQHLLDDRDGAIAARARTEALERFHPEIIARHHLEIYRAVLAERER
jgi:glycosyltransferase involved in cell wall biosynthesis